MRQLTRSATRTATAGLATVATGVVLAAAGLVASPAGAAGHNGHAADHGREVNDHQIVVCHALPAEANPYTLDYPSKWQITEPNGHGYHEGDIIPPFDAGSHGNRSWEAFDGLNWDEEGQAVHAADCTTGGGTGGDTGGTDGGTTDGGTTDGGTTDGGTTDGGTTDGGTTDGGTTDGGTTDGGTTDGGTTDGGTTDGGTTDGGTTDGGTTDGGTTDGGTTDGGTDGGTTDGGVLDVCLEDEGVQTDPNSCTQLIPAVAIENAAPPAQLPEVLPAVTTRPQPAVTRPATQVLGTQITRGSQQLAQTGSDTITLFELGLGMVLLGAGAMVFARRQAVPQG